MVVTTVRPFLSPCFHVNFVLVPDTNQSQTVANGHNPRPQRIVELQIEVVVEILFPVEGLGFITDVVDFPTCRYRQVICKERESCFDIQDGCPGLHVQQISCRI